MNRNEDGAMLKVSDVARRLCVSERSVFRWIEAGKLRAHRFGKALRISKDDLEAFLDASTS